jgi:type I restriction enzyme S subunit
MPSEWRETTVDEIKDSAPGAIAMGPFGSDIKTDNFVPSGVPVIRGNNLGGRRFKEDGFVFLTEAKADSLRNANAFPGDLVFTHRGTLGQVGLIPEDSRFPRYVVSQSQMKLSCDRKKSDPLFLYYFFISPLGQAELLANANPTGVPAISQPVTSLKRIRLRMPPLPTQHAIARVLGALDDKIELNRKMNETLEKMAQAIFKSWFVDFEPFRDKGMVDSPLGKIPKGWKVKPLPEAIDVNPSRSLRKGCIAPYLDMQNMPTRGHRPAGWIQRGFGSGTRFMNGDTLVARITPCLENGKTAFVDFLGDGQVGWGSTEFLVLRPKPPLSHAIQNMTGSSGRQRVPPECLAQFDVVVPDETVAVRFGTLVAPFARRIKVNGEQSRTLAAIRDALLPKLMSGEVRVS